MDRHDGGQLPPAEAFWSLTIDVGDAPPGLLVSSTGIRFPLSQSSRKYATTEGGTEALDRHRARDYGRLPS